VSSSEITGENKIKSSFSKTQQYTGGPPYPWVIRSKTYRSYVKPRIIPKAIY